MKRKIAYIICVILSISLLTSCGTEDEAVLFPGEGIFAAASEESTEQVQPAASGETEEDKEQAAAEQETPAENEAASAEPELPPRERVSFENVSYVMIYNPTTYNGVNVLSTGTVKDQFAENGEEQTANIEPSAELLQSGYWNRNRSLMLSSLTYTDGTAEVPEYTKGSKREFFYGDPADGSRTKGEFTCVYAGTYCNIWSIDNSIIEKNARARGAFFDKTIYPKLTALYGTPRFTEEGRKVNILVYPMAEACTGFFTWADIYSSAEVDSGTAESLQYNTDHAILNICSHCSKEQQSAALTRELENLITATDTILAGKMPYLESFLNIVTAAHASEVVNTGSSEKAGLGSLYYTGDGLCTGQSLYFTGMTAEDMGSAGAVYLFEEYLAGKMGDEVFAAIHEQQRRSDVDDSNTSRILLNASGNDFIADIAGKYDYSESVKNSFADEADLWLSKVTLDFYLQSVELAQIDVNVYAKNYKLDNKKQAAAKWKDYFREQMLYTGPAPDDLFYSETVDIYGGGCILARLAENTFTEPEDADDGLIYIGFDENFQPVCSNLGEGGSFLQTEE